MRRTLLKSQAPPQNLTHAANSIQGRVVAEYHRLAGFVFPHTERLNEQFLRRLKRMNFDDKTVAALLKLTAGAAAGILTGGHDIGGFLEEVEYNGRRLAKLNVPPTRASTALEEYDAIMLAALKPPADVVWAIGQLRSNMLLVLNDAYYQVREAEAETFFALFQGGLLSQNLDELLTCFLDVLQRYCRSDLACAYLAAPGGWEVRGATGRPSGALPEHFPARAGAVRALKAPRCFNPADGSQNYAIDPQWKARYRTCWSVPLHCGGRFSGVLQFAFQKDYAWLPREQELLAAAAERAGMAMEKAQLLEDLARGDKTIRQLARRMIRAEELERRRISRELHDETGQSLLCIRLQLEMLENSLRSRNPGGVTSIRRRVRETRHLAELTIVEMRRLIAALSPSSLEQFGLCAAIRQLVKRFRGIFAGRVDLSLTRLENLPDDLQIVAFRVIQESLSNIAKHSQAGAVKLSVRSADEYLRIEVSDNGIGFDTNRALSGGNSFGLHSLQERVNLLGGSLEINSRPKSSVAAIKEMGTRMIISIPLVLDTGSVSVGQETS